MKYQINKKLTIEVISQCAVFIQRFSANTHSFFHHPQQREDNPAVTEHICCLSIYVSTMAIYKCSVLLRGFLLSDIYIYVYDTPKHIFHSVELYKNTNQLS